MSGQGKLNSEKTVRNRLRADQDGKEARLDGEFDRTLQQLEHLHRMRQGQPVPPTVKLNVERH